MDMGFILLIMKGYTSSYQIWNYVSKNPNSNIKSMAYNNVNKRILSLHKKGYLEEIKAEQYNLHGRKDYKVTIDSMEQLIPYLLLQSKMDDFKAIAEYVLKSGLDDQLFRSMLANKITDILIAADNYCRFVHVELQIPSKDIRQIKIINTKKPVMAALPISSQKKKH